MSRYTYLLNRNKTYQNRQSSLEVGRIILGLARLLVLRSTTVRLDKGLVTPSTCTRSTTAPSGATRRRRGCRLASRAGRGPGDRAVVPVSRPSTQSPAWVTAYRVIWAALWGWSYRSAWRWGRDAGWN